MLTILPDPWPPLTLTLSPFAPKSATGRGDPLATETGRVRPPLPVRSRRLGRDQAQRGRDPTSTVCRELLGLAALDPTYETPTLGGGS